MFKLRLLQREDPPVPTRGFIQVFADSDGVLKTIDAEGTVSEIGSGGGGAATNAVILLGPFPINFDDPNLVNPSDNGISTLEIPAGSFVRACAVCTTTFDGVAPGDELILTLATSPGPPGLALVEYKALELTAPAVTNWFSEAVLLDPIASTRAGIAVTDCHLWAAVFAAGAVTAGACDLYALVATPTP